MPQIVILDTNILTVPAQFGVDIFAEAKRELERSIDFVVLDSVVKELERNLEISSRIERHKFRIALDLVKRCIVVSPEELTKDISVDNQILEFARSSGGVIATNDRNLIEHAQSEGIPVLYLRGKKHLELRGSIR